VALPQLLVAVVLQRDPFRTVTEALEKSVGSRVPVLLPVTVVGKRRCQPVVVALQVGCTWTRP
jgi:hypothetical protein